MKLKDVSIGAVIGLAVGAGVAGLKYLNVYQSPHGGRTICVHAVRVAENPFHIHTGLVVGFVANVPNNYIFKGPLISRALIPPSYALGGGLAIGALLGLIKSTVT